MKLTKNQLGIVFTVFGAIVTTPECGQPSDNGARLLWTPPIVELILDG